MPVMGLPGAHVSIAGAADKAVARATDLGCDAFQIFVKSPNRWSNAPRSDVEATAFREAREAAGLPVVAHAGYLINLASPKPEVAERSQDTILQRVASMLGYEGEDAENAMARWADEIEKRKERRHRHG